MSNQIIPPSPTISEEQHRAAFYKWCLNRITYDFLYSAKLYKNEEVGGFSAKESACRYDKIIESLLTILFSADIDNSDAWDNLWLRDTEGRTPFDAFKASMTKDLGDVHCGDCTAAACSCLRCCAEELYGIPSSVTWKTKGEGANLLAEFYRKDNKH